VREGYRLPVRFELPAAVLGTPQKANEFSVR
jgi:hypothetical protein